MAGAFPAGSIYMPADHVRRQALSGGGNASAAWPSLNELVAGGKRVMFVSGQDYGPGMDGLLFSKSSGEVCGWQVRAGNLFWIWSSAPVTSRMP